MKTFKKLMLMGIVCCVNSGAVYAAERVPAHPESAHQPVSRPVDPYYYVAPPMPYQSYGQVSSLYPNAAPAQPAAPIASGQTPHVQDVPVQPEAASQRIALQVARPHSASASVQVTSVVRGDSVSRQPVAYSYYCPALPAYYQPHLLCRHAVEVYDDEDVGQRVIRIAGIRMPRRQAAPVSCEAALQQAAAYTPHPQVAHGDTAQDGEATPVVRDDPMVTIPDRTYLEEGFGSLKMHRCARRSGLLDLAGRAMRQSEVEDRVIQILDNYECRWSVAPLMQNKVLNVLLGLRPVRYERAKKKKRPMKRYE